MISRSLFAIPAIVLTFEPIFVIAKNAKCIGSPKARE